MEQTKRTYSRGGLVFRWLYSRWRQVLAFGDLLGADGRPSSTKLMSISIVATVLFTAIASVFTVRPEVWNWPMFWILALSCSVMFGRWGFDRFMKVLQDRKPPIE
jgi:hypothetical protein